MRNSPATSLRAPGFTLIELILVMALLLIVVGTAAPSLSNFFRGRNLDSEARRFLSLTRYAQSRAVSESLPMLVWIDPDRGAYGLTALGGYTGVDTNAVQFVVKSPLTVEVHQSAAVNSPAMPGVSGFTIDPAGAAAADPWNQTQSARAYQRMAQLRFMPDGFIGDSSPDIVVFREEDRPPVWLARNAGRMHYEIQTNAFSSFR